MPGFDLSVLDPKPASRRRILTVLEAALAAVDPRAAVRRVMQREGDTLQIGAQRYDLTAYERVYVVGAGKAGAPMFQAVCEVLGERIKAGLVVVKTGHSSDRLADIAPVSIVEASHPIPDEAGAEAGRAILALADEARSQDLVIALLSGGGSALLVAPAEGITLADKQAMTNALLACGATINEVNCLRKHCSAVKGGQLARAAYPATLVTLALSDVIRSPLDVIASGPTVADATTWQDAWQIIQRYELQEELPPSIVARLQAGLRGEVPDTPKAGDAIFAESQTLVVADNRIAAQAAADKAQELGMNTLLLTTYLEGDAAHVGRVAAALGKEISVFETPLASPACLIMGGETTVALGAQPGQGGRNQELALSAALALEGWPGITVVSLATDGTDGPTDSAGGLADSETVARGRAAGLDAEAHLRGHDAYPYLQATHDLLHTGPTQTNVNDLVFVFVLPETVTG